jgi:hypothetical protein
MVINKRKAYTVAPAPYKNITLSMENNRIPRVLDKSEAVTLAPHVRDYKKL